MPRYTMEDTERPATANRMLMGQFENQRYVVPRPDVTDVFGYGDNWSDWVKWRARTLMEQMPHEALLRGEMPMMGMGGVTAFHGSPHRFTKFDMGKVGTGRAGGTSFGLGINLSKDISHAKVYGKNLYKVDLPDESLKSFIKWESPVADDLAKQIPPVDFNKPIPFGGGATIVNDGGQWLLRTGSSSFRLSEKEVMRMFGDQNTGEQIYRRLVASLGDERAASEWLNQRGVRGIINNTERNAENYVVFDDQLPKIIGNE